MSKEEMNKADKNAIKRKIKKHKKIRKLKDEEKQLLKTGLTSAENRVLEKNKSKINKKIADSKTPKITFTKSS